MAKTKSSIIALQKKELQKVGKAKAKQVLQTIVGPRANLGGLRKSGSTPLGITSGGFKQTAGNDFVSTSSWEKRRTKTRKNPQTRINQQTYHKSKNVGAATGLRMQKNRNNSTKRKTK